MPSARIPVSGFKECDIRGEMGTDITADLAYNLGRALGTLSVDGTVIAGGDFRTSTPDLLAALVRGICDSGARSLDLGQLTTPAYYFARRHLGVRTGAMITASHNPASWNGFKIILSDHPITVDELETVRVLVTGEAFAAGSGQREALDIRAQYGAWLAERFAGLKDSAPQIIFDCGNGASGWVIDALTDALGLTSPVLFKEPDGAFPNRHPDIARPDDLADLQRAVPDQRAQLGFGFDGDGDRVGVVDHLGHRVPSDRLIAWLAGEVVRQHPGRAVIYDVKLSDAVPETVAQHGGRPVVQKSGHTFIKAAMLEHDAIFGGEYSGHLFFGELSGDDDGLFAALLIASLVAQHGLSLADLIADIPRYYNTPDIRVTYTGDRQALIAQAVAQARAAQHEVIDLDGIKVLYPQGWGLLRASVTEPALTLRFEGRTPEGARAVIAEFLAGLDAIRDAVWRQVERYGFEGGS